MSATSIDDEGLVCAFWLAPVEPWDGALKIGVPARVRPMWLHFNLADARARRWLEQQADISSAALKALLEREPRIHLETLDEGRALVAVLGDLHHDFGRDPEGLGTLRLHLDQTRLLTVRRHRLRTLDRVRRDLLQGPSMASAAALFEHCLRRLVDTFNEVTEKLTDEVDVAEDEILTGRYRAQGTRLGTVRRTVARLRRHLGANRTALSGLRHQVPPVLEEGADERRLQDAIQRFDGAALDLDGLQERTRLLQEEIAARLAEGTNRSLFVMSTITVALLPITLITGIFGMNVGGLPWLNNPAGFRWTMLAIVFAVTGALWFLFHQRRRY
jgi:zinc transporter